MDDIDTINKSDKLAFNNLINMLKDNYKSNKNKNKNNNKNNNNSIYFLAIMELFTHTYQCLVF